MKKKQTKIKEVKEETKEENTMGVIQLPLIFESETESETVIYDSETNTTYNFMDALAKIMQDIKSLKKK